jgi:nucleotide-binding universal stress UspA family protein
MLRTILVPLDGSALAERALPIACDIARRAGGAVQVVRAHVPIAVVGATAEGAIFSQDMLAADDALRQRAQKYADEVATKYAAEWGLRVTPVCEDGSPAGLITDIADRSDADLIVMTTHGAGGFTPDWLGSVADSVIRHSHRPVLALPENDARLGEPFTLRAASSSRSTAATAPARYFRSPATSRSPSARPSTSSVSSPRTFPAMSSRRWPPTVRTRSASTPRRCMPRSRSATRGPNSRRPA